MEVMAGVKQLLLQGGTAISKTSNANDALLTKYHPEAFQKFSYWSHLHMLYTMRSMAEMILAPWFTNIHIIFRQRCSLNNHFN
jgi:hypothetical protein